MSLPESPLALVVFFHSSHFFRLVRGREGMDSPSQKTKQLQIWGADFNFLLYAGKCGRHSFGSSRPLKYLLNLQQYVSLMYFPLWCPLTVGVWLQEASRPLQSSPVASCLLAAPPPTTLPSLPAYLKRSIFIFVFSCICSLYLLVFVDWAAAPPLDRFPASFPEASGLVKLTNPPPALPSLPASLPKRNNPRFA